MIIDKLMENHDSGEMRQWFHILMQLHDKQIISTQSLISEIGFDPEKEMKLIRKERESLAWTEE
jgi:hypothetical protein